VVQQRQASIFSPAGLAAISEHVANQVDCPNGHTFPATVADYGETVYCPQCGTGVLVGESLERAAARARAPQGKPAADQPLLPTPNPRYRTMLSRLGAGTLVLLAGTVLLGGYLTWRDPQFLPTVFPWIKPSPPPVAPPEPVPPEPTSRPLVGEFLRLVDQLEKAVAAADYPAARKAGDAAEAFFTKHQDEVGHLKHRYLVLKAQLRELEEPYQVEALFQQAGQLASVGKVTEAFECEARAKFIIFRRGATTEEKERLNQRLRAIKPTLDLACGKRAVEDAERCLQAGDDATRKRLLTEANTMLAHLPGSQTQNLMERMEQAGKAGLPATPDLGFVNGILYRHHYEEALLKGYAVGEVFATVDACCKAHQLLAALPKRQPTDSPKLARLVFEMLDFATAEAVALPDTDAGLSAKLLEACKALDRAEPWRTDDRWQKLDATLRQRGEQIARRALDQADELASKDQLPEAIAAADLAQTLGPPEVVARAKELTQQWQGELKRRAVLAEQEAEWKRIDQLRKENKVPEALRALEQFAARFPGSSRQKELEALLAELKLAEQEAEWKRIDQLRKQNKVLEALRELDQFAKRFPQSSRRKELEALKVELQAVVDKTIDAHFRRLESYEKAGKWAEFRKEYDQLRHAPQIPPKYEKRLKHLELTITRLEQEAEKLFQRVMQQHSRKPVNKEAARELADAMSQVLELNPMHREAGDLWRKYR
jgi:hypothetical protein